MLYILKSYPNRIYLLNLILVISISQISNTVAIGGNTFAEHFQIIDESESQIIKLHWNDPETDAPQSFSYSLTGKEPQRMIALSTTFLAHIIALELHEKVIAVDSTQFAYDPRIRNRFEDDSIVAVGSFQTMDREVLYALKPDIVFISAGAFTNTAKVNAIQNMGIEVFPIADYLEDHPLGRAEWIKCFAAIWGLEKQAKALFSETAKNYESIKQQAAQITSDQNRPTVLLDNPYNGIWWLTPSSSYIIQMIEDAGGRFVFSDQQNEHASPRDLEWMLANGADADIWLNVGNYGTLDSLLQEDRRFRLFKATETGSVFSNFKRRNNLGGNDYFESGVAYPDRILRDLFILLHGYSGIEDAEKLTYYYPLK